jgi:farnesyl diphosphate synthase
MADDMIDNSEVRRGKPCWYLCPGVGNSAINDTFIIYGLLHYILDKYFADQPYYSQLTRLFHSVYLKTGVGQSIDIRASRLNSLQE